MKDFTLRAAERATDNRVEQGARFLHFRPMSQDSTFINRALATGQLALESTMLRLKRLKAPERAPAAAGNDYYARGPKEPAPSRKSSTSPAHGFPLFDDEAPPSATARQAGEPAAAHGSNAEGPARPAGRIEHDSRGSAVWNWALDAGASALESTQRLLKRLEAPALEIDEKPKAAVEPEITGRGGYDPYNRGKPNRRR